MLARWDPFRDFLTLRHSMDRLFDRFFEDSNYWQTVSWSMPLDVIERDDEFVVKASLPGINPDDLEITYSDNVLTIKGEIKREEEVEEARYHLRERRYGSFSRSISLPTRIDADQIEANYESGELHLRLPKTEEVRPKRIQIQAGSPQKMIEGQFQEASRKN